MPRVFEEEGCKFMIYTNDHEPAHVHVLVGDGIIIIELDDNATISKTVGKLKASDIRKAQRLTLANRDRLLAAWSNIHGHDN